tara:strand:+ start:1395 stop:1553 length:159 start_codon:yes stop_codon:yes gene_type:complete
METVAVILGLVFVGIILLCLIGTIGSYIADAYAPNNKLEENIKKLERKNGYR